MPIENDSLQPEFDDPWEGAIEDILGDQSDDPYVLIPHDDIAEAEESHPLKAHLMQIANEMLSKARERAEEGKDREPSYHDMGWEITLETEDGQCVGLSNNWLGNRLFLGYPYGFSLDESLIRDILKVDYSSEVRDVNAVAVNSWNYEDKPSSFIRFKDEDKPLEENEAGQIIAFSEKEPRRWARFFGPIENGGGRVWVDHSLQEQSGFRFPLIKDMTLESVHMGRDLNQNISTFPFSFFNKYAYEGPTANSESVQKYRDRFIQLAAMIACSIGQIVAVHIDYGFVFVPEELEKNGFSEINWVKGMWGVREGWDNELVMARKGNQTIALQSKNSLVPWSTVIRTELQRKMSPEEIQALILNELLYL